MKNYLILTAIFIIPLFGYSQTRPLAIGDTVPDISLTKKLNFKNTESRISSFKGKLLIIDFWATWCAPCVSQLPKNDSLQKIFDGKVQFLSVSNERQSVVKDFLKKLEDVKHIKVPSLVEDSIFNNMFPHQFIPYFVWIDSKGKVVATTEENQINEKNIQSILAKQNTSIVNFSAEKGKLVNSHKPLFVIGIPLLTEGTDTSKQVESISDSSIIYQSTVTRFIPGLPDKSNWNSTGFWASNAAILNLYQVYFGLSYKKSPLLFFSKNRYKIEVKDSTLFNKLITYSSGAKCLDWLKTNGYSYEMIWKTAKTWDERFELLKGDLDRYFAKPLHFAVKLEKRMAPSDVLTLEPGSKLLVTKGQSAFERHDKFSYVQHNLPLSHLVDMLQSYFWQNSDRTLFDETNFKGNVDLELSCNMNDEQAVNEQLAKYGLKFLYGTDRFTDILIIKDDRDVQR